MAITGIMGTAIMDMEMGTAITGIMGTVTMGTATITMARIITGDRSERIRTMVARAVSEVTAMRFRTTAIPTMAIRTTATRVWESTDSVSVCT
jgi:hypothetical protein